MELFYSDKIENGKVFLSQEESGHCIRVLRHRCADVIDVIDGEGSLYKCRILSDSPKAVEAELLERIPNWGTHPYHLTMAVAPTKNMDRYEWFAEKACEAGIDVIAPVIGEHSERKVLKTERVRKILLSASKQSLKASVPKVDEPVGVTDFIKAHSAVGKDDGILRLIAYCFEDESVPRRSMKEVLQNYDGQEIMVLIGPEGDFSRHEAEEALANGFVPIHLGPSRFRTETAALAAVMTVYNHFL